MPTIDWNKCWGRYFQQFISEHPGQLYGLQWGDPDVRGVRYWLQKLLHPSLGPGPLFQVLDRFIVPYVTTRSTVLEIGPGGGRWTRYLVRASRLICVDINPDFFDHLRATFPEAQFEFYRTQGYELAGIHDDSVDFVFTFGTFVHVDSDGISGYLVEIRRVLKPGGVAVVHYADKRKRAARLNPNFSAMTADIMETIAPMPIIEHEKRLLKHSNLVVFRKIVGG